METRNQQLIEKFFSRSLSAQEQAELDNNLAADPSARDDFDWQKKVAGAVKADANQSLRALLEAEEKAIRRENEGEYERRHQLRVVFRRALAAAAVLLPLFVAVWLLWPQPPFEDRVAAAFDAYPNKLSGRDNSQQALEIQASNAYDNKDYTTASNTFGQLSAAYPDSLLYTFYHGVSLVGSQQYAAAVPVLSPLASQTAYPEYQTAALFYLAQAQAGAGQIAAARATLITYKARADKPARKKKAEDLMDQLPQDK